MEAFIVGVVFGLVLSFVLFIQKIWNLEDKVEHYRTALKHYKMTCKTYEKKLRELDDMHTENAWKSLIK